MLEASCSDQPIVRFGTVYWETGTHPGAFVSMLGLFHSFRVLEFIHVSLKLLDVLGKLPILAQPSLSTSTNVWNGDFGGWL